MRFLGTWNNGKSGISIFLFNTLRNTRLSHLEYNFSLVSDLNLITMLLAAVSDVIQSSNLQDKLNLFIEILSHMGWKYLNQVFMIPKY